MRELVLMVGCIDDQDLCDMTPTERAARVTAELLQTGSITNRRVRELTGLTRRGATFMITALARKAFPLVYDEQKQHWYLVK